jgi:hypothetical protein
MHDPSCMMFHNFRQHVGMYAYMFMYVCTRIYVSLRKDL